MKKVLLVIFSLVTLTCQGQTIRRSQWTVRPVVKTNLFFVSKIANLAEEFALLPFMDGTNANMNVEFLQKNSWFIPEIRSTVPLSHVGSPDGASISRPLWWREFFLWGDYSHTYKFSAGYELYWKSMVSPWGIFAGAEWEYNHLRLKGGNEAGAHYSQAIVPYAGIRVRIGGGTPGRTWMPAFEVSGAYVNNFKYHSEHGYSKDALNNGLRGSFGAGVNISEFSNIMIRYEHDFFDHFDKDFTPDEGETYPFEDYNTRFGNLSLTMSVIF